MKKILLAALLGAAFAPAAMADAGDIIARFRMIHISPEVSKTGVLSDLSADVGKSTVPELDFTYMFTNNIGAELILGTAKHTVTASVTGNDRTTLGDTYILPPTLTLQYHFAPQSTTFRPYVGAGLNYTRFYKTSMPGVTIDKNSFGPALQIGADIPVSKDFFVNVDVKKLWVETKVTSDGILGTPVGTDLGKLKIDPWVFGVGVGMKF